MSVSAYARTSVRNESATFEGMCKSFRRLKSEQFKPFLVQINWLLRFFLFDYAAPGPTVILGALTCLDKGPETGGFSHLLGVAGFISAFM